ncbi:MAG: lipoyl(octanoyl) transferase LipB [Myxococcota bacterium]|nr:lipoyl(octanoyl) transferase LipB [Myxococcota bacterium]
MRTIVAHWLGRVRYAEAHAIQQRLVEERLRGNGGDTLLLLEHDPVVTLGRGANPQHVLEPRERLEERGVDVHDTARGGDVTYHGPGQLVAYPILDLRPDRRDVRRYVRDLARVMIALARDNGLDASFIEGDAKLVGVWVDEASPARWRGDPRQPGGAERPAKLGAIGVHLSRWITMHGFAFNISTDLAHYGLIVPCGIARHGVTSVSALGCTAPTVEQAARASLTHFASVFDAEATMASAGASAELREGRSNRPHPSPVEAPSIVSSLRGSSPPRAATPSMWEARPARTPRTP